MSIPVLIDCDMAVSDAAAVLLTLAADELELVGIATVGGAVRREQAAANACGFLAAASPKAAVPVAAGAERSGDPWPVHEQLFRADGMGGVALPKTKPSKLAAGALYAQALTEHAGELVIITTGPLTNLGALLGQDADALTAARRVLVVGGAVFGPGNVTKHAEYNLHADADAARALFGSGAPVTLVPLDVTRQIILDESHRAHLAASGSAAAGLLAQMLEPPMQADIDAPSGQYCPNDVAGVAMLLWPRLFLQSTLRLEIGVAGDDRGRTRPVVGKDKGFALSVVLSVQAVDLLERIIETLCKEHFIV